LRPFVTVTSTTSPTAYLGAPRVTVTPAAAGGLAAGRLAAGRLAAGALAGTDEDAVTAGAEAPGVALPLPVPFAHAGPAATASNAIPHAIDHFRRFIVATSAPVGPPTLRLARPVRRTAPGGRIRWGISPQPNLGVTPNLAATESWRHR